MKNENDLPEVLSLLESGMSYEYDEEGKREVFFRNEDLDNLLTECEFSEDSQKHCRKFLDARKEWGFLYTGIPMDVIDKAKGWDVFDSELLRMDSERLDKTLSDCYYLKQVYNSQRQQLTPELV